MDGLAKTKEYGQIFADPGTAKNHERSIKRTTDLNLEPFKRNMIVFMTVSLLKSYQVFRVLMIVWPLAKLITLTLLALQPVPIFGILHPLQVLFNLVEVHRNRAHESFSDRKDSTRKSGPPISSWLVGPVLSRIRTQNNRYVLIRQMIANFLKIRLI